jgi:hypothetical protein
MASSFRVTGPGLYGFLAASNDDNIPDICFGAVGYGIMTGVLGFSGGRDPEGPIQQNSYSQRAGVEGGFAEFTGVAGVSLAGVGVYGQVEDMPPVPGGWRSGVFGAAATQPGVTGFSREGDGMQGASFTGTALRAVSFFGNGVHSISGSLTGVTGISGTQGPIPTLAVGVFGSSDTEFGVIGTSNAQVGVAGLSTNNIGVVGQTDNPNSFAGLFNGNVVVNGLLTATAKNGMVAFPDGTQRVLHCMESPEHWFEDFGSAKLKNGRVTVKLDADFAKTIKAGGYHVFVTPAGDCRGLYVRGKTVASFEVRELGGGTSSVAFSYRIVGKRRDITRHRRFEKIHTPPVMPSTTPRLPRRAKPTAAALGKFIASLEKEAHERSPKRARKVASPKRTVLWMPRRDE